MVAELLLKMGQRRVVATLEDDLNWQCLDDLLIHSFLNAVHGPPSSSGNSAVPPSHYQARRAAAAVEGAGWEVELRFAQAGQDAA